MREIEHLQKQWRNSARFRGLHASMTLKKDGLVLGANTVLAKRNHDGTLAIDGEEEKLLTMLSVAYGRPVGALVLGSLRRASDCAKAGDACLAGMHVALALPALRDPEDAARRLFIADGLLAKGGERYLESARIRSRTARCVGERIQSKPAACAGRQRQAERAMDKRDDDSRDASVSFSGPPNSIKFDERSWARSRSCCRVP